MNAFGAFSYLALKGCPKPLEEVAWSIFNPLGWAPCLDPMCKFKDFKST